MPVHVHIRMPDEKHKHHGEDGSKERPGWSKHREPAEEKHISSLTAGAGHDRWAQRASKHSGPQYAPGIGTKKSSQ